MPHILKINDAAWLYADTYRTPMQVGVLATFSMPEDADDCYLEDMVNRWREVRTYNPPFSYVLRGPGVPRWKELRDDEIDLDYHLRHSAVPSPGGERELGVLVSRLHSQRLDRRYPLWECHLIEGVAPRKWSLYLKVHHSQIDGVGGIRMAKRMFSVDASTRDMLPPWAVGTSGADQSGVPPREKVTDITPVIGPGSSLLDIVTEGMKVATSVVGSVTRTYAETLLGAQERRAIPYRAPKSVLNGRIAAPRRFATQRYEVDRLRAVAKAAGGSINDVFLAICGAALRHYLQDQDALPKESLTANVPVSVREEGEPRVGNAITFLYAKLGTDIEDPLQRLLVIRDSTRLGKSRLPDAPAVAMDAYTTLLMGPFLGQAMAGVGGYGPPAFNVVISNVPGFQEKRYFDGSLLEAYYPLSLLFHGQALNITAVSNAGSFCIGYTGSRDAIPHLQRIAVYSGEALEELEAALGLSRTAAKAVKAAKPRKRVAARRAPTKRGAVSER
jgi:diacylglycerol O-acyltransferase